MSAVTRTIALYRSAGFRVTAYDNGDKVANFVLGLRVDEPIDLWYARAVDQIGLTPMYDEKQRVLYFPQLALDAATFHEVVNA